MVRLGYARRKIAGLLLMDEITPIDPTIEARSAHISSAAQASQ